MTREAFAARWADRLGPAGWRAGVSLASLTTFRVGGPAEWLADIGSTADLEALVADAADTGIPVTVLGGGSNVLVADAGVPGVVIRLRLFEIALVTPDTVRAGAGVTINGLVRWTIGRGLAGLERWAGTPGTVGGAIHGNAHWAGVNIGDLVRTAALVDRHGRSAVVPAAELGFAYDTSRLKTTREVLVWAEFGVAPGDPAELRARAKESLHYRKATQPLAMASAGCVFQNPTPADPVPADVPRSAGALVDRAGLKGHRRGGAQISPHHANFIVNDGRATAADIRALIEDARGAVRDRFGVELLDEVVFLGNF